MGKRQRREQVQREEVKADVVLEYERVTGCLLSVEYITDATISQLRALLRKAKKEKGL